MDFNDYCKTTTFENTQKDNFVNTQKQSYNQKIDEQDIQQKLKNYQNLSQNDLMAELLKETNKQKQNGNLDNKKLTDLGNQLKPILDSSQQAKLDEILKMLR